MQKLIHKPSMRGRPDTRAALPARTAEGSSGKVVRAIVAREIVNCCCHAARAIDRVAIASFNFASVAKVIPTVPARHREGVDGATPAARQMSAMLAPIAFMRWSRSSSVACWSIG